MTTTMLYTTGASVEEPAHMLTNSTNTSGRARHRPKALQIKPLDPNELSAKLDDLSVQPYGQLSPMHIENSTRPPLSARTLGAPSPRTIPTTHSGSSTTTPASKKPFKKEKVDDRLSLPSPSKPPRRGSIFDAFRFKGSNYKEETQTQEVGGAEKPARYKHVPQVAAQQFARTTTVEPLTQKASPQGMRPAPGPRLMSHATMSLQDYHRQYQRAQSLCSGRASIASSHSRLASVVGVSDPSSQPKKQNSWGSMYGGLPRRMSTGNMSGKNDLQPPSPFRRDSSGIGGFQGSNSSSLRRGSASSSGFSDTSSSFTRESGPGTPLKQEFGGNNSPYRRGSETSATTSGSRRGSFVPNPQYTAEVHRADWSQSDQSTKNHLDPKWVGLKHRKTSISQQKASDGKEGPHVVETVLQSSNSARSPKPGFFKRFMH